MTSRVQKGGPIFRPLARQKSRTPAASQNDANSHPPSAFAEQEHSPPITSSSTASVFLQGNEFPTSSDGFSQSATFAPRPINLPVVAPSLSMPPPAPKAPSFPRASAVILSQPVVLPSVGPPSLHVPFAVPTPQPPPRPIPIPTVPPVDSSQPLPSTSNFIENNPIVQSSPAPSAPRTARHVENVVKRPRRGTSKAVVDPATQNTDAEGDDGENLDATNETGKKTRKRRTPARKASAGTEDGVVEARPTKRKKRATKSKQAVDVGSDDDDEQVKKPRGRARKRRSVSLPSFDPNADPGEEIDPTVVTMAALCSDTGHGRVSSKAQEIIDNHSAWKAANRERRTMMKFMMERKKYGQPEDADEVAAAPAPATPVAESSTSEQPPPSPLASTSAAATANVDPDSFDYSKNLTASRFNVQVRIGPNGETIIDEESLVVDRAEGAEEDTSGYTHVVESDRSKFTNSSTYGRKLRGTRWSAEETELFYEALSQYGENYELISYVLPGRDRKSCKNKFKAEDKRNPGRINYCLNNSTPVDMDTLSRMTGRDFSGPTPEIAIPKPAEPQPVPSTSAAVQEQEGLQEGANRNVFSSSKSRKHSRSRSRAPPEEGLTIIGDLESFVDHDKD